MTHTQDPQQTPESHSFARLRCTRGRARPRGHPFTAVFGSFRKCVDVIGDRSLLELAISASVAVLTFVALDILRLELQNWRHREVEFS